MYQKAWPFLYISVDLVWNSFKIMIRDTVLIDLAWIQVCCDGFCIDTDDASEGEVEKKEERFTEIKEQWEFWSLHVICTFLFPMLFNWYSNCMVSFGSVNARNDFVLIFYQNVSRQTFTAEEATQHAERRFTAWIPEEAQENWLAFSGTSTIKWDLVLIWGKDSMQYRK